MRVLLVSEQGAPNVSVHPDTNEIGTFDAARREDRRFGALFDVARATSGHDGGQPTLVPPAPHQTPGASASTQGGHDFVAASASMP